MSQGKREITFKYIFNYGYNPSYVNGAQGGLTPRGEFVIHFYQERPALPAALAHEITPQGAIGRETTVLPKDLANTMVRFIDTGITMNYDTAKIFHAWLGDKIRELETVQKSREVFEASERGPQA